MDYTLVTFALALRVIFEEMPAHLHLSLYINYRSYFNPFKEASRVLGEPTTDQLISSTLLQLFLLPGRASPVRPCFLSDIRFRFPWREARVEDLQLA